MLNVLLTGVGGQGTVLAAKILAQAAQSKGWQVRTAETIGMAQRGGSVMSHVRIGDGGEVVHAPLIMPGTADVVIAFEPGEAARALPYLAMRASRDSSRETSSATHGGATEASSEIGETMLLTARSVVQPVTSALSKVPYRSDDILCHIEESLMSRQNVSRETIGAVCSSDMRSQEGSCAENVSRETFVCEKVSSISTGHLMRDYEENHSPETPNDPEDRTEHVSRETIGAVCSSDMRSQEESCAENVSRETSGVRLVVVDDGVYADKLGTSRMLNTILLASAVRETCLPITRNDLEEAIAACVKPRFLDLNLAAISLVFDDAASA